MGKSVKVHDDTHAALKQLKTQKRSRSLDEVVRSLIREATGVSVEQTKPRRGSQLTAYMNA
jgi:predicted CopG family antitoxin